MIRLAAVGDIHVGIDSVGTCRPHYDRLADVADALLLAGDLTRCGTPEEAEVLADEVRGLPVPVVAVLGNHDHHAERVPELTATLEDAGVVVLDDEVATFEVAGRTVGVAGSKGFGGGFASGCATAFGEPEMKAFVHHTERIAARLEDNLQSLDTDVRIALLHYAPIEATLHGERPEIWAFLGSYLLGEAIDRAGADLALHGHAHAGSDRGETPAGVPVRNVAQPLIGRAYQVFCLDGGLVGCVAPS